MNTFPEDKYRRSKPDNIKVEHMNIPDLNKVCDMFHPQSRREKGNDIKFGDLFIHVPTRELHQCVGFDEGLIWYIPNGEMESKGFDPGDCSKHPSDLFPLKIKP